MSSFRTKSIQCLAFAACAAAVVACDADNSVVLAQREPDTARDRCAYVVAHREEVQVGWRSGDVHQLLGSPDYERTGIDGTTSLIYNATCGSFAQQLVVKTRQGFVSGVYW